MGYKDWNDDDKPAVDGDHDWPSVAGDFDSIPVIDLGAMRSSDIHDRKKVATDIREACTRVGFFYIENHGIAKELIDGVFRMAENFFTLPFEQKMDIFIDNSPNFRGYTPVGGSGKPGPDGKGNLNEAFEWGLDAKLNDDPSYDCNDPHMKGSNRWPAQPAGFEDTLSTYYRELRTLCRSMAKVVAMSLDLPEDQFDEMISHPGASVVMAHYPPMGRDSIARSLDAHTDSEFFTILAPGPVRALEVMNKAGKWISAPPNDGTFIFNVGDQLQAMTNHLYISTRHRVMNYTGEERYSIPFFFSPNYEAIIKPIPKLAEGGKVIDYPPIPAGQMYKENMTLLHRIASTDPEFLKYRNNL